MLSQQALHKVSPKMTLLYSSPEVGSGRYIINLMVFNTSLRQGAVPKGPTSPGTLPTESPTPIPSKIIEAIISSLIDRHLADHKLIEVCITNFQQQQIEDKICYLTFKCI